MKKIIFILMLIIFTISAAYNLEFTQDQILDTMKPHLENAKTYKKFKEVQAKKAKGGEIIYTITSDGIETKNTAKAGDYIVKNTTDAKETYILTPLKFDKRYEYLGSKDDNWNIYKAKGKIKAIKVDDSLLKQLKVGEVFYFSAPWGEKMIVKKDDFLVSPLDYSEVYRIAKKEFFETYKENN